MSIWCQFKISTKLKYVAADGAGCFVARIDPLDLKKKKEVHYYVTLRATSSSVTPVCSRTAAGDWMQIECICEKRGLLKKRGDISWESGYIYILFTHQACGVKFLLTFGATLPRDLKIWAVYNREANVALLNTFKPFVQITLPVFQAIPDGAILQYGHSYWITNNSDKAVSTAFNPYLEVSFLLGRDVASVGP